jgi:antitoxin ParD1/3/4
MRDLKRELSQQEVERLRELWDAGIASGSAGELDLRELRRNARTRLKGALIASRDPRP